MNPPTGTVARRQEVRQPTTGDKIWTAFVVTVVASVLLPFAAGSIVLTVKILKDLNTPLRDTRVPTIEVAR